ncbi:alpha/beta fold hydrolase [Prescottella equi]|uniref:alpha/beta fold hydrolase n=1 Tax=Rhodococcus hoagii TaxID=43767 RepID=UPI0015844F4F|nr:alpha/beta hydrolase [Prescottella equi]
MATRRRCVVPRVTVRPEDRVISLRDGRSMGFADYGPADGFVVVNAHGGLSCRLDIRAAAPVAEAAGIRLISPDRPGIGLSDPSPGRTVLDWASDVEQLADQLGVERMGVLGWSMGGQYAAALGYALSSRISRIAIVAGALPLTEAGTFARLPRIDRLFTRMSVGCPGLAEASFRGLSVLARAMPRQFARISSRTLAPADAELVDSEPRVFAAMIDEGLRNPAGVVEEYRAWMRPWGFEPEDLEVPVDVWWGDADQLIPREWPAELATRIPKSTLNIGTGGHFMAHLHYRSILDSLADVA